MRELWLALFVQMASVRRAAALAVAAEDALIERVASRDPQAFAELYDRHTRAVFSLALRVLGDQGDAEDVVQDVFEQAWRQAERFDPARGQPIAWLLNITRSRAIDRLRRRRLDVPAPDGALSTLVADGPGPDALASASVDARALRSALASLPWTQRLPIELAYFEGLSQTEIAQRLEEPVGTIKTRVRLGLLKLRDVLLGSRR